MCFINEKEKYIFNSSTIEEKNEWIRVFNIFK